MSDPSAKDSADKKSRKRKKKARSGQGSSRGLVQFSKEIQINPQSPMPDKTFGAAKAYEATGQGSKIGRFFAIICEPHLVPRIIGASAYSSFINSSLLNLVGCRVVYWPPAGEERYAFIYEDVLGPRLLNVDTTAAMGLRQDDIMDSVVQSMVNAVQDFRDKDFFHGLINPYNMYRSSTIPGQVVLGDCLSMPAGYAQPILYETIERGMADPIARGKGTLSDDLYALGVSLTVILRSTDPLAGLSDKEIIEQKIELGSYAAITGKDRFKGSILELLRGLLHDDIAQRWTIDEVMSWMDGLRLSPKQGVVLKKASRPLSYLGQKYTALRPLAMNIGRDPTETSRILESGEFFQWLQRSLEDEEAMARVEAAQRNAAEKGTSPGSGYEDRLISNLSSALDPIGPLRFRDLCMMGEGIGAALAEAIILKKDLKPFADIFIQKIAMNWITAQENPNLDVGALVKRFDNCRAFLGQRRIGFGIERCVYVLSPEVHCLSEKLKGYCVSTPEHMVKAFEKLAKSGDSTTSFIDRHSAAFLSVRDSKAIDSHLFDLDHGLEHRKIMGNLKTIASIQARSNIGPLHAIAKLFLGRMDVLYNRYHDQDVIDDIDKNVRRYAEAGDLVKMVGLLDNPEIVNKDLNGFKAAMMEYKKLKVEYDILEGNLDRKEEYGRRRGGQFASIVASILSVIIILFMALMFKTGHTSF